MELITYKEEHRIAYITLNRPDKRNALSPELVQELKDAFDLATHDNNVKVIVLKANGPAFCAGADLGYLQKLQKFSYEENKADSLHLKDLFQKIYTLPKVVIAQIEGHALAGGCGLANVCDFAFAVPEAKFGFTEVRIGFIPAIVMVYLIRKVGDAKARALLLSGRNIAAQEALGLGLINEVIAKDEIELYVNSFAKMLIENNSTQSMALTKQMLEAVQDMKLDDALEYAAGMNAKARASEDCKRGIAAFLNREEIRW